MVIGDRSMKSGQRSQRHRVDLLAGQLTYADGIGAFVPETERAGDFAPST
jgi:hypothetical protein